MNIFTVSDGKVTLNEEVSLIPEFKQILNNYKGDVAKKYFSYIYFLCDFKSPYSAYSEEDRKVICKKDFIPDLEITADVIQAVKKYNDFQDTVSLRLFKAAKEGCEKLIHFCNEVDLNERDKQNRPVYKANDLATTLKQVAGIKQSLEQLEDAVKKEISQGRNRGGQFISRREE